MKYYLDTEFDGFGGTLLSLGIVREDGESLYFVDPKAIVNVKDEWVRANILPILHDVPEHIQVMYTPQATWGADLSYFFKGDDNVEVIVDWPADAIYFSELLLIPEQPGFAVPMGARTSITILRHIDVYPTTLEGAVQHNAWWDAMAIKEFCDANHA